MNKVDCRWGDEMGDSSMDPLQGPMHIPFGINYSHIVYVMLANVRK